ncbi:hypothetical protein C9374_006069 [Naegleria lovaniensis]|uniref:Intron-binding protein aquarius n=1 Tax=Naegleria lovaniensis TaxID=51637 RepID=A0AA88GK88_NAELO|nr:uncharacterized protein C9374_006069 [Naegleria lovaniensis]KAG2381685.1 hypothetical protein C9374_006069 [Naegleria lovaniensis]
MPPKRKNTSRSKQKEAEDHQNDKHVNEINPSSNNVDSDHHSEAVESESKKIKLSGEQTSLTSNEERMNVLTSRLDKYDEKAISEIFEIIQAELLNENSTVFSILESFKLIENFVFKYLDESKQSSKEFILTSIVIANQQSNFKTVVQHPKFDILFKSSIALNCETATEKLILIVFLINCFSHIDLLSKLCLDLVSLPLWKHVNPSKRNAEIEKRNLSKYWKKISSKKTAEDAMKSDFLPSLVSHYLNILNSLQSTDMEEDIKEANMIYCERFLEFLIDLLSQLPTRRFSRFYLSDAHVLEHSRLFIRSGASSKKFSQLVENFDFYLNFDINDDTGVALSPIEAIGVHSENIQNLQHTAFRYFPEQLRSLYLQDISTIQQRNFLESTLKTLSKDELLEFAKKLNFVGPYETGDDISLELLIEIIVANHEKKLSQIERINKTPIYPTEKTIWEDITLTNSAPPNMLYKGSNIPLPKLSIQYLSLYDYLLRNYTLYRQEKTFSLKRSLENIISDLKYVKNINSGKTDFLSGFRMALPLSKPFELIQVAAPKIGESVPSQVQGVISIDLSRIESEDIRKEWENIRKNDILFLVHIKASSQMAFDNEERFDKGYGVISIRGCELIRQEDQEGNIINAQTKLAEEDETLEFDLSSSVRKLVVLMDPVQYVLDKAEQDKSKSDLYSQFNLVIRQKPKDNNFKAVLESIRNLMNEGVDQIPDWITDYVLGYEPSTEEEAVVGEVTVDFRDTFMDENHLKEALSITTTPPSPASTNYFKVSFLNGQANSYHPYIPRDVRIRSNNVHQHRFNTQQVKAITSALLPEKGLVYIQTPPSCGKYQVLTKIIENLYLNHPQQRIVIITRSNLTLNAIFENLEKSRVHERHLLRLGGEKNVFSKFGRVNYMLAQRLEALKAFDILASSLGMAQFINTSCETASHVFIGKVFPRWKAFLEQAQLLKENSTTPNDLSFFENNFPFIDYFKQVLEVDKIFQSTQYDENMNRACELFSEISLLFDIICECKVFENVRNYHGRSNHILTHQSRVVGMTSTHAAIKRSSFKQQQFDYNTLIIEDAARISEIESFIPMSASSRLNKIILLGDNNQLPPLIYNKQVELFSNMAQSMFTRFSRFIDESKMITLPHDETEISSNLVPLFKWNYPEFMIM